MNQTLLESGLHLARRRRQAIAGRFPLAYWTDDGSEAKGPHGHADAHFMLITSGRYHTGAREDVPPAGFLLIFNPAGTYHRDQFAQGGGAFFTITVPSSCWRDMNAQCLPQRPVQIALPEAQMLTLRGLRALCEGSGEALSNAEALSWELIGSVAGQWKPRQAPGWLAQACDYLRDNRATDVSLAALSAALGIHPVHLTRTFRTFLRCTPGEYLRAWRVEHAARLLTEGRSGVAEIATACGFSDQSHLNRQFSRAYGVSPGRYRRLTRGH